MGAPAMDVVAAAGEALAAMAALPSMADIMVNTVAMRTVTVTIAIEPALLLVGAK